MPEEGTSQRPPDAELPAIDRIRVEMLSTEMPVHQLAKAGHEEIRIIRRAPNGGQVSLYWKVEANPAVGHPGQLAYHLDTWIIKRRLDQMARPIPRLVRIGDLRQIARDLDHGGDTNAVKRAFEQNASAFIRAKVAWRAPDGREERFEGYFNRYNVFFRGQTLPGGTSAETVYISLNDPYHAMINRPTWRPLDYRYLRTLAPSAQRFYELLSPKMFAAIKNGHPTAWIRYSDFCSLAVARRQTTRQRMQSQMAVVHRPHLASGYLATIAWRPDRTADGMPDWTIHYVPGRRAKTEFAAFNAKREQLPSAPSRKEMPTISASSRHKVSLPMTTPPESSAITLVRRFMERRHGSASEPITSKQRSRAFAILAALDGDLETALTVADFAADEGLRDRRGYPKHLGGVLEGGFIERARTLREERRKRAETAAARQHESARRERYEIWCRRRAEARIDGLSKVDRQRLVAEQLTRTVEEYRYFLRQRAWSGERISEWAEPRILKRFGHEGEPSFEEWSRVHDGNSTGSSGPDEALQ